MKKLVVIILSLVMTFSVVACNKKEKEEDKAVDLFEDMIENLVDIDNMSIKGNAELALEQLEFIANPLIVEMNGEMSSHEKMKIDFSTEIGMFPLEAEVYFTKENWLIYSELVGSLLGAPYMSFNIEDNISQATGHSIESIDLDVLKSVFDRFEAESEFDIYDILIIDDKITEEKITINEEKIKTQHIMINVSFDSVEEIFYDFMAFVLEDDQSRELMLGYMTDDEILEMKNQVNDPENRQELALIIEGLKIEIFQINVYINEALKPVKVDLDLDAALEYEEETFEIKLKVNLDFFNFDQVEDIQLPDVNPSDVEDIMDLLSIFF